jgi:tetratricopeptide (TPR) repeat protein
MTSIMASRITGAVAVLSLMLSAAARADSQDGPAIKQLFEAGKYQDVFNRAGEMDASLSPEDRYLVAQAHLRTQNGDAAKQALARLEGGDADPWTLIARSERARIDGNLDEALSVAQAAVAQSPPMPAAAFAQYQLGLVMSQRQDMGAAADSFEKASGLDPGFAYALYYAGMAYSAMKRLDRVASHFEAFLKLAPEAPERSAVESVMRTIRGK